MNNLNKDSFINDLFKNVIKEDSFDFNNEATKRLIELFSVLTENTIWIINHNFELKYIGKTIEQLTGYTHEEFNLKQLVNVLSPQSKSLFLHIKEMLLNNEFDKDDPYVKLDFEIIKKNNIKIWAEVSAYPIYKNNQFKGIMGFAKDVTGRKMTEKELIRNRNRYLTFFESSPVALMECDYSLVKVYLNTLISNIYEDLGTYLIDNPDEIKRCIELIKIQEVNETTYRTYKVKNLKEFSEWMSVSHSPESLKLVYKILLALSRDELSFESEGINHKTDSSVMHINYKWNVVPGYEELYSKVIVSVTDISKRILAEENMLKAHKKLKRINRKLKSSVENERKLAYAANIANESKNRFLSTMSHEIRTPLNGILGMSQLLKYTELSDEQNEYLDVILESNQTLVETVNNIFEYSKAETESIILQESQIFLYETVINCVKSVATKAYRKNLEIYLNWNFNLPDQVIADINRIRQLFLHVIENAIKFTKAGYILITLHQATRIDDYHYMFNFSIQDTGIGMDNDSLEKIFEPFYQADGSSQRKFGGTGLGLTLVNQIIKLYNGSIVANSLPDQGTQFHISLPLEIVKKDPVIVFDNSIEKSVLIFESNPERIDIIHNFFSNSKIRLHFIHPDQLLYYFVHFNEQNKKHDYVIVNQEDMEAHYQEIFLNAPDNSYDELNLILCYKFSNIMNSNRYELFNKIFNITMPIDLTELYKIITQ